MYDKALEQLIDAVIADGIITEQERKVVYKKAKSLGIDQDEIEVYLEGRLESFKNSKTTQSGKLGIVRTCPNCGSTLIGGLARCPECGHTISNVEANSSAKILDKRLRDSRRHNRPNIIRSFPIPNTREDLIEFLSSLEPKALVTPKGEDYEKRETNAYYEKYVECLNKARISFGDDSAIKMFIEHYNSFHSKKKLKVYIIIAFAICIVAIVSFATTKLVQNTNQKSARERIEKLELQASYEEWCQKADSEIQAYSDSLFRELDKIPAPTTRNWQECGRLWNRVTWSKSWEVPDKYKSITRSRRDKEIGKSFEDKKNNIGSTIRAAHQQELMNHGMKQHEAHNATGSEFYEIRYW